ncbi:MerR family transcriptional regulator [Spiractinospora alimapuensis]|uniref:MerR family transcriptional regulator n=1 Tax=Spiractinospora alimapuensis TaxID=2820884 RepID=UPI001F33E45D|nr:MerR family transcriptional regulator [Spiractinospora alimapuensis]QVQ54263.1 MerR family transcriptional regulator [Spiractinospora alimapuensis]
MLTPAATARLLGVAPTTLRSWDRRYGIGPDQRSSGGHRRYSSSDIERLRELCRLVAEGMPPALAARQVRDAPGDDSLVPRVRGHRPGGNTLPLATASSTLQGVARAAMRMDSDLVERRLQEAMTEHGTVRTWEEIAQPLLYGMGRKWQDTRRYVEVEHLLSWSISTVLRRVPSPSEKVDARERPVVLACVPDEMHCLPVEALAAALREVGTPHRVLGQCTPTDAIVHTVDRLRPRAVLLWCQTPRAPAGSCLLATVRAAARTTQTTQVHRAGLGWHGVDPTLFGDSAPHSSLTSAFMALRS